MNIRQTPMSHAELMAFANAQAAQCSEKMDAWRQQFRAEEKRRDMKRITAEEVEAEKVRLAGAWRGLRERHLERCRARGIGHEEAAALFVEATEGVTRGLRGI